MLQAARKQALSRQNHHPAGTICIHCRFSISAICRGFCSGLPWHFVVGFCCGFLPWVFSVDFWFVRSFLFCKYSFLCVCFVILFISRIVLIIFMLYFLLINYWSCSSRPFCYLKFYCYIFSSSKNWKSVTVYEYITIIFVYIGLLHQRPNPVGKSPKKTVCRSLFLTIYHFILSAELTKMHSGKLPIVRGLLIHPIANLGFI